MPIRFPCQECGRLLSIARRKAGTPIDCPKCGYTQTVPEVKPYPADTSVPWTDLSEPQHGPLQPSPGGPVPHEMVLVSRRTIYAQGALLAAIGLLGLVIGYFIGRGGASVEAVRRQEAAQADRVLIEGKLLYQPGDKIEGDDGAVAIFLPKDQKPPQRIETPGIRPEDAPPPGYSSLQKIRDLGGAYVRADAAGDFSVVLPRSGDYYVLLISAATRRADESDIRLFDVEDLNRYFRRPEYLIGRQKYRLTKETLAGYARLEHDFGRDRR